ncbi:MAG: zinc-ribbon domain-containing protein, partial [Alphaproteobacteria bacterium]
MLITCPNCQASFEFPQDKMRPQGRKVACGACSHQWKIYPQDENIAQQAVAEQPQSLGEPKASTLQSLQHQLMNMQAAEGVSLANALPDGAAVKTVIPPPPTNGAPANQAPANQAQANQTFANQAPAPPNQVPPNQASSNQASSSGQNPIEGNSQVDSDDIFGVADDAPPPANMDFDLPDQHGNTGESNNIDATANFDVPSSDFDDPAGFDQPNPQQAEANQTA